MKLVDVVVVDKLPAVLANMIKVDGVA